MVGRAEVTQSLGSPGESLPVPAVFRSTELAFPLRALATNSRNPFQSLPATLHFCHIWPLANCNSAKNILSRKEPDIVRLKTIYGGDAGLVCFCWPPRATQPAKMNRPFTQPCWKEDPSWEAWGEWTPSWTSSWLLHFMACLPLLLWPRILGLSHLSKHPRHSPLQASVTVIHPSVSLLILHLFKN